MRHGVETFCGIHYKLRMMGAPIDGSTYIFGDNMSVIFNTSRSEYQLGNKSNSICYHAVRYPRQRSCATWQVSRDSNYGEK